MLSFAAPHRNRQFVVALVQIDKRYGAGIPSLR
jgi:hypothetical protein